MSTGGMSWAYRMIEQHRPDALGIAVLLHLGWRDHPDFCTDRGIARALCRDRASIRRATQKLAETGIITRRSGQWVAVETVEIIHETPNAPKPSRSASDDAGAKAPRGREAPGGKRPPGEGARGPRGRGREAPTKRRENMRRGPADEISPNIADLSRWQRTCVREGKPLMIAGKTLIRPESAAAHRLRQQLREIEGHREPPHLPSGGSM